jgi:hypothetical protein
MHNSKYYCIILIILFNYLQKPLILSIFDENPRDMSKKKRKFAGSEEEQWNRFVTQLLSRPRTPSRHKIPEVYVEAVADSIFRANPTKQILISTLEDFASVLLAKGYGWHLADSKKFRDKRTANFERDWKQQLTTIDDLIHPQKIKPNQNKK